MMVELGRLHIPSNPVISKIKGRGLGARLGRPYVVAIDEIERLLESLGTNVR